MPTWTTWYVVITVREGAKTKEIKSDGTTSEEEAKAELDVIRTAMKQDDWIDLPWFTARAEIVQSAHLESSSVSIA
jgi:hypothetical protein